jgi:hypothetical protein
LPAAVPAFLQTLVVLYEQTIAHGQEIIQLATHLGLRFKKYSRKATRALTGVILQKRQGNKLQYSLEFYDKAARVAQMRQGRSLTKTEHAIVRRHVRFDVTVHSAGVLTLVGGAIRRLRQMLPEKPRYFRKFARRFLNEEPQPTVWWLERAVWILSHTATPDHSRQSFGSWLIPQMLRDVLRLDSIARFKAADLHALLQGKDRVVTAWRSTEGLEDDWAGALAQAAHCSKAWVYVRRKQLLATYSIDISFPFAFYRDLIFFGPNSLTPPQDRAALNAALVRGDAATNLRLRQQAVKDFDRRRLSVLGASVSSPLLAMSPKVAIPPPTEDDHDQLGEDLTILPRVAPREPDVEPASVGGSEARPRALNLSVGSTLMLPDPLIDALPVTPAAAIMMAVDQEDGSELVRLHAEALADFEKKRNEIVNPALVNPPRAMELKLPFVALPRVDDLPPDFDDIGLDEVVPTSPISASPKIASPSRRPGLDLPRQGPSKESSKKVVRTCGKSPPPPPEKKRIALRFWRKLPPPLALSPGGEKNRGLSDLA